jgi:hypothetical protein
VLGAIVVVVGGMAFLSPLSTQWRAMMSWSAPPPGAAALLYVLALACAFCAALFTRIALTHGPDRHPLMHVLLHRPDDVEKLIRGAAVRRVVQGVEAGTFQTLYVNVKGRKKAIELEAKIDTIDAVVAEIEAWLKDPRRDEIRIELGYARGAAYRDAPKTPPPVRAEPGVGFLVALTIVFALLLAATPWLLDRVVPYHWTPDPRMP